MYIIEQPKVASTQFEELQIGDWFVSTVDRESPIVWRKIGEDIAMNEYGERETWHPQDQVYPLDLKMARFEFKKQD